MRFTKMHGIGNDYVYVDCFQQPMPADPAELARKIADRHFGVGGDGLILAGARVYYAMANDGVFFKSTGRLNTKHVPAMALVLQGIWTALLVLPRTRIVDATSGAITFGNLYSNLLDYIISAALIFYILTIAALFVLRRTQPNAERPYRACGYPILPALYIVTATTILIVLAIYRTQTTWPGLVIVLAGVPVYFLWRKSRAPSVERT